MQIQKKRPWRAGNLRRLQSITIRLWPHNQLEEVSNSSVFCYIFKKRAYEARPKYGEIVRCWLGCIVGSMYRLIGLICYLSQLMGWVDAWPEGNGKVSISGKEKGVRNIERCFSKMVDHSASAGAQEGGSIDKLDPGSITNQIMRSSATDQFSISFSIL